VWRDALRGAPGERAGSGEPAGSAVRGGSALWVKLAAVALCLLAAGGAVIVAVGASTLRGQLMRQADQQLRAYAVRLTSQPFQALGMSRVAPAAAGLNTTTGAFSIELRSAGGQLVLSAGPGTRPTQAVPVPFARVPARDGVLVTVPAAGGGSCLVIAEPVRFMARRLVFGYGADDFAVTSRARHGTAGILVVGLHLAGIGRALGRLTLLGAAVIAGVILLAAGSLAAMVRFSLRPLARAAQTADAAAAGRLSRRVPGWPGGLAGSLNRVLDQAEARLTAAAAAEAAARTATDQMGRDMVAVARKLARPVSLLHGLAGSWLQHGRRGAGDTGRTLSQVAEQAARAEALLTELDGHSPPGQCRAGPGRG